MLVKGKARVPVFISVHDVYPEVMPLVQEILELLRDYRIAHVDLLIVPGKDWATKDLEVLRGWQDEGFSLVGHGWCHQASERKSAWHRIHSFLISRNVAEHLSKSADQLTSIITDCFAWFSANGLNAPHLYVPPAWAMGSISRCQLARLPFQYYEYFSGIYDSNSNQLHRMALLGYEADTSLRSWLLRSSNRLNQYIASWNRCPIRLSIHPHDLTFHLSDLLRKSLRASSGSDVRFSVVSSQHWLAAASLAATRTAS